MSYQKERDEFIAVCARNGIHVNTARNLLRLATSHGRVAVAECNGPGEWVHRIPYPEAGKIYEKHQADCEKKTERLEATIKKLCEVSGLSVQTGGDPRGYTVRVVFPDGSYNTWGGKEHGYGIPQRN